MKEIEWQFEAHDLRPVARWLDARQPAAEVPRTDDAAAAPSADRPPAHPVVTFVASGATELVDTYVDTPDWRFHKAGLAARIRIANGRFEGTLKTFEPAVDGLRVRTEIEAPLSSGAPSALLETDSRTGAWARSLAGIMQPDPLFTLHSTRQVFAILVDGISVGEVALDETSIDSTETHEPVRLKRVEVEVEPSVVDTMRPFVDDLKTACRLTPATTSKFEVGLLAVGLVPQGLPDVGPVAVPEGPTMGQLAYAVIRRSFLAFLQSEPLARVGEDPEGVHDMRVAIRRMRAALRLFEPALARRARPLRQELRWVGGILGDVRDLDIQLAWIRAWADEGAPIDAISLGQLVSALEHRQGLARARMLRALDTQRYNRLVARLTNVLRAGPPRRSPAARTPALSAFPGLIEQGQRRARKAGRKLRDDSAPEAFHRMRIRCKRLRYSVEAARDLYGPRAAAYVNVLARIQDILGEHQDAVVAASHLQEILQKSTRRLPTGAAFLMGRMSQRYEQQASKLRKRFRRAYPAVRGKAWSRLQRAMEKSQGVEGIVSWPPRSAAPSPSDAGGET